MHLGEMSECYVSVWIPVNFGEASKLEMGEGVKYDIYSSVMPVFI